jgi:hypothetical protein
MAGWLPYVPEQIDFEYWGMHPDGVNHKVSSWPRPGSLRVDARYRMLFGKDCLPSAQRFLLRIRHELIVDPPTAATKDIWALLDLVPIKGGHIEATTNANADGLVLRVSAESMELLPDQQVPGVLFQIELSLADNGSVIYWEEYATHPGSTRWTPTAENWVGGSDAQGWITDPLWTYGEFVQKYQSGSECYAFERQSEGPEGFAEFNGVDSYIALTESVPAFNSPFRVTCDFRIRGQPDWMPIWGNHDAGGFKGMDQSDVIFGIIRFNTTWNPTIDVWHTYRYDFEQTSQLQHQLYIDGINVMDRISNRPQMSANRLGVYRQGGVGSIWGHFDLRFLKYEKGTVGNFTTELEMPLQTDALDLSDNENHGTTFNMELPSI